MLTITAQQGRERYKVIPKELQDLIFAETTKEVFDHIGEENHLDTTKTYELGRVAGLVLLGFLHHDDTRKELQEALGVNPMVANELQNELNKKLFTPIADILEKVYSPLSKATLGAAKSLDSIVPSTPMSLDNMPKPAPLAPSAPTLNLKSEAPKPSFAPSVPPASFQSTQSAQATPTPTSGASSSSAKVSPLVFTKTPAINPAPTEIPKPMVFVTQTGGQTAPVGNVPKFKIETPGTMTGSAFSGSTPPTFSSAPRPAKIELGFSINEKKQAPTPSFTFETQKSSVRYGAPVAPTFSSPAAAPKMDMPAPAKKEGALPPIKISSSPLIQPASPSLGGKNESVPSASNQSSTTPPPAPKFEPPKPLL